MHLRHLSLRIFRKTIPVIAVLYTVATINGIVVIVGLVRAMIVNFANHWTQTLEPVGKPSSVWSAGKVNRKYVCLHVLQLFLF